MQTQTIEIGKVKLAENVRTDYGDLTELTASIKENGVLFPVVLDKDNTLRDGYRRIKAAQAAGRKEVPYVTRTEGIDRVVDQLIAGIFPKNLDPFEEAKAFADYMKATKTSQEALAKKLGKTQKFIDRRLHLNKCAAEVKKAVLDKQISVAHAAILGQLEAKQQKAGLKMIIREGIGARQFAEMLQWHKKLELANVGETDEPLLVTKEKEKQFTLGDVAAELRPAVRGNLENSPAFKKDLHEHIEKRRKQLREQGILVYSSETALKKDHPNAVQIRSYDAGYGAAVANLKKSNTHGIVVTLGGWQGITTDLYRLEPKTEKASKKAETPAAKEKAETPAAKEKAEKELQLSRKQRLENRNEEFKHSFLTEKTRELMKPGSPAALTAALLKIDNHIYGGDAFAEKAQEIMGFEDDMYDVATLLKADKKKFDQAMMEYAKIEVSSMENEDLELLADSCGFKWEDHFVLTQEYVDLYTKDALVDLAKEFKYPKDVIEEIAKAKAKEAKALMLKHWKKGMVPKILAGGANGKRK